VDREEPSYTPCRLSYKQIRCDLLVKDYLNREAAWSRYAVSEFKRESEYAEENQNQGPSQSDELPAVRARAWCIDR